MFTCKFVSQGWDLGPNFQKPPLSSKIPAYSACPVNALLTSKMTIILGVIGLKTFVIQDSDLKLNSKLSFYYHYLVAEMACHNIFR